LYGFLIEFFTPIVIVEELLLEMTNQFVTTGNHKLKPTIRSVNTCLDAWAKSGRRDADERILVWLNQMRSSSEPLGMGIVLIPDKWTYNAYLQALPRSMKCDIGTKAVNILSEMETRHRSGCPNIKPDVLTFTSVLHCIALSQQENSVELAMSILSKMEDLHEQGYGDLRPNLFTYNW
jgi:Pentatricopeptide repeat domain